MSKNTDHIKAHELAETAADTDGLSEDIVTLGQSYLDLEKECNRLANALSFYADPETYFAIGFFPDPPCGPFIDDFSDTSHGSRPGKLARSVLERCEVTYLNDDDYDDDLECAICGCYGGVERALEDFKHLSREDQSNLLEEDLECYSFPIGICSECWCPK